MANLKSVSSCRICNPLNYELNSSTLTAAATIVALAAIAMILGTLAILASFGVPVGAFNSLSALSYPGGILLLLTGGVPFLLTLFWIVKKGINSCEEETIHIPPPVSRSFNFPAMERSRPFSDEVGYPTCFSENISVNSNTVFRVGGRIPYPACTISVKPYERGSLGTTPYIIAATPQNHDQKVLFYKMVDESNASLIVNLCPLKTTQEAELLRPNETIQLEGSVLRCEVKDSGFDVSTLKGLRKPVYQLSIAHKEVLSDFEFALNCARSIKGLFKIENTSINTIRLNENSNENVQSKKNYINNSEPMIIISPRGNGTGSFAMLLELLTQLEEINNVDQFVGNGNDFWDQALNMATHIEEQSFPRSAFKWANTIFGNLLRLQENVFQYSEDTDEYAAKVITADTSARRKLIHDDIKRLFRIYLKKKNQRLNIWLS